MIFIIDYLISNVEFVVSTLVSVLAIIISALVAKNILKKELSENRKLEIEMKEAEILQQVRNYNNSLVIRQIDNLINLCFEIIGYLEEIESLKLSNKVYHFFEDMSKIPTMIKKYDLFREFAINYRLNTLVKYKYFMKLINANKNRFRLLEDTIEFNKVKISIELTDFSNLMDYLMQDTQICQNIVLETNKLEQNKFTTNDDRIKYMNNTIENIFQKELLKNKNEYEILYLQMSNIIRSLYKIQPVISEFIIDFEED